MADMTSPRCPMPQQDPAERAQNFKEVALGYTPEMAIQEAGRCLHCKRPFCVEGCPVNVRIPDFIARVADGDFEAAYQIITSTNGLPAISGRVCPQENQCEAKCVRLPNLSSSRRSAMQIRSVLFIVGVLLVCVGASLVLPLGVSLWYGDGAFLGLLSSLVIMVGGGLALAYTNRSQTPLNLTLRDGFAVVGICWIVASFAGGLPFVLTSTASVTDAVFEAASGFTTTGATIFADIEGLPHGLLMWRSLTHWIGGLGIILLSLIVLPLLGVGGMQLYRAEVTGPSPDKLTPRMQDTALTLWRVYCLMTIVLTVLLYIAGMDWFDALNHSFSTVATGGFSTKNNSIAAYPQASIQWILIFFMFIAGINFSLHAQALRGVVKVYLRDRECRFYTVLLILGSAVIVAGLVEHGLFGMRSFPEFEAVTRAAVFQLVSVCTTTGFVSENFNLWPSITLVIILMFMLMGGCAGSTGGGVKVMRLVMLFRLAYLEIFRLLHPHSVRHLKIAGKSVPVEVISGVVGFFLLYLIVTTVGTIVLTVQDMDLVSAFTATLTCISNVGPGLGSVGPVDNFSHVPTLSKWVLTLCMLLGRLEIYAILVLFIPEFWRD